MKRCARYALTENAREYRRTGRGICWVRRVWRTLDGRWK